MQINWNLLVFGWCISGGKGNHFFAFLKAKRCFCQRTLRFGYEWKSPATILTIITGILSLFTESRPSCRPRSSLHVSNYCASDHRANKNFAAYGLWCGRYLCLWLLHQHNLWLLLKWPSYHLWFYYSFGSRSYAMPKHKQVWLWSFGLTKIFLFRLPHWWLFRAKRVTLTFSVAKLVQAVFCKYQVPYSLNFFKNFLPSVPANKNFSWPKGEIIR